MRLSASLFLLTLVLSFRPVAAETANIAVAANFAAPARAISAAFAGKNPAQHWRDRAIVPTDQPGRTL